MRARISAGVFKNPTTKHFSAADRVCAGCPRPGVITINICSGGLARIYLHYKPIIVNTGDGCEIVIHESDGALVTNNYQRVCACRCERCPRVDGARWRCARFISIGRFRCTRAVCADRWAVNPKHHSSVFTPLAVRECTCIRNICRVCNDRLRPIEQVWRLVSLSKTTLLKSGWIAICDWRNFLSIHNIYISIRYELYTYSSN